MSTRQGGLGFISCVVAVRFCGRAGGFVGAQKIPTLPPSDVAFVG